MSKRFGATFVRLKFQVLVDIFGLVDLAVTGVFCSYLQARMVDLLDLVEGREVILSGSCADLAGGQDTEGTLTLTDDATDVCVLWRLALTVFDYAS